MGISVTFSVSDLVASLTGDELKAIESGEVLNGESVWYQFLTQQDSRVRDSHAALHGTYWRTDDVEAPTPPLDYNCRCFIRYCAAPDSPAAEMLPEATGELTTQAAAYESYLTDNYEGWEPIAKAAKTLAATDRMAFLTRQLEAAGVAGNVVKDVAFMILSVL